jgi:hypothetical protein
MQAMTLSNVEFNKLKGESSGALHISNYNQADPIEVSIKFRKIK